MAALVSSRALVSRLTRRYGRASTALQIVVVVFAIAVAVVFGAGRLDVRTGTYLLIVPLALIAALRPAWLVMLLMAIPPAGGLSVGLVVGSLPIVALLVLSYLFQADVTSTAAVARENFLKQLTYDIVLFVLAFSLVRTGQLRIGQLVPALLIGAGITAFALLLLGGFNPADLMASTDPTATSRVDFHDHFGYLSAIGFLVSLAWALSDQAAGVPRPVRFGIAAFFVTMTALSFTRGAWLAAMVGMLYIPRRTRQYRYMLLVPLAAALLLLVPSARERLFADIGQGGVSQAFATGQIGTGRWGLWQKLVDQAETAPVTGHGSGFAFSLDSTTLFGFSGEFGTSRSTFVYPHNDFLFWGLEFGLMGVGFYVAFWLLLRGGYKRLMSLPSEHVRRDALLLSGVLATMLIAELVDNGIFIRPVVDRFFVAAGAMLALASSYRTGAVE